MAFTQKGYDQRETLASRLALNPNTSALAQVKSFSTDGSPLLLVGAASAGSEGFFLKITTLPTLFKDIIGNAQAVYATHIAQVCFEANYAGTTDNVADVQKWPSKMAILGMLAGTGMRIEVYESANGTAPTESTIASGNLKTTFNTAEQYPLSGS